jgi:hypothetical protein
MLEELQQKLATEGTVRFSVHVQPGAPLTRCAGALADGSLKITLTAPPAEGKANQALIRFLADTFDVPKNHVSIVTGLTGRRKIIEVTR